MSDSQHGSSTINTLMIIIVVAGLAALLIGACGSLPQGNGVSWDSTAELQRNETARLRIIEEEQTARLRIAQNADTQRTWAIALASVAVIGASVAGVVMIARTQAQRQPATIVYQIPAHVAEAARRLPAQDAYRPEQVDGQWLLISDKRNDWMTVDDAHRLTG